MFEWAQVTVWAFVIVVAARSLPLLWIERRRSAAVVLVILLLGSLIAIGEEVSWGQRLIGFDTPDVLVENRQGETNVHNDARIEPFAQFALFFAGSYGVAAPALVRPRTPLAPPPFAIPFFAVVATYFAFRLLFLDTPTYIQAKYSEWPELCFAVGAAMWCFAVSRRT